MTNEPLISQFRQIVGTNHVLTGQKATERFRKGFRSGEGSALCVVRPGTLLEYWNVLQACVDADKIIIMQAAKTGLTEGSTPKETYGRDVVLVNSMRIDGLQTLQEGRQVLSFAQAPRASPSINFSGRRNARPIP